MQLNPTKETIADRTETTNFAEGEAFEPDDARMALYKNTINNLIEDTYYQDDEDSLQELVKRFHACADEHPDFPAKLAAYARSEVGLRDVSQVLLVLASNHEDTRQNIRGYGADIVLRPDDAIKATAFQLEYFGSSFPNPLRDVIEEGFNRWDEYQYAKYRRANRSVSLVDVVNLVHPTPADDEHDELLRRLTLGEKDDHPDVEPLRQSGTWEDKISEAGQQGGVTADHWREAKDRMGIFATIRNVRNMRQAGMDDEEILTDEDLESVENARFFPWRIYQSYKATKNAGVGSPYLDRWFESAIEKTVPNVPDLSDAWVIADVSGSMRSSVSNNSLMQCDEISTFFAACAGRVGATIGVFASDFKCVDFHADTPVLQLMNQLQNIGVGGSTNGWKVIRELRQMGGGWPQHVILLTDMQLWDSTGRWGSGTTIRDEYHELKGEIGEVPNLYMIDLQSYGDLVTPEGEEGVYNISGWHSRLLDFVHQVEHPDQVIAEIEAW